MKPAQKANKQQNEILLIEKIKIPVYKDGSKELKQKLIKIDLNGARLFKLSAINNGNRGKQDSNSIEQISTPESSFPIIPQTQVYQINANDDGLNAFLKQIGVSRDKTEAACLYCNTRDGSMFPLIFQSKAVCVRFHEAVLVYKLYHRHLPGFKQVCEKNNLNLTMNLRLLQSLAKSLVSQNIVIDPEDLSVVQMEEFELQVMKDAIQQFISKTNAGTRLSSLPGNRPVSITSLLTLFSLELRYKIVDQVSLSYLPQIVPQQLLYKNMRQFSISKCSVNDRILSIMLKQQEPGNFILRSTNMYENLVKLDLSYNELTDMSFLTLSVFFGYTPKLADLCLAGNRIKLETIAQLKKQEKQDIRMSKIRMSTGFFPNTVNKNEAPLIQFLLSLQYLPLNYLNVDNNLIEDPQLLVNYIIEGQNVPIRYLSIKNNKISQVDKIRMAKLIMGEVKERKDGGSMVTVDFGYISVVDEEVYQYVMLLKDKSNQLGLESQDTSINDSRRSTKQIASLSSLDLKKFQANQPNYVKVSLTLNKQWQLCDQEGILQVSNLYKSRRKTSARRSQIVSNILMNSSLSPSSSSSNLKKDDKPVQILDHITAQTFKPTVNELNKSYLANNYSAIHLYKSLLKEYNLELYNKKVAPTFEPYQKEIQKQQKAIMNRLNQFINFQLLQIEGPFKKQGKVKYYDKLNSLISKLFMLRFENEVNSSMILYEGTQDEVEFTKHFTWNVFTYLLYLKHLCDVKIEKMILNKQNPMLQINQKLRSSSNLYTQYFLPFRDELCDDNYEQILNQLTKQKPKINQGQIKVQDIFQLNSTKNSVQKQINQLLREKYLRKCKTCAEDLNQVHKITEQQKFLCIVEPRLMFTGYLIKYYCPRYIKTDRRKTKNIIPIIKCSLHINKVKLGQPISKNITNYLSFISTYDMLSVPPLCINPTIPPGQLPSYESLKLSVYNPVFQPVLQKFSSIVIAFMKFLHHSPRKVVPQTLQYLNYLINMILSEEDSYNVECLSTQFYIQLFTFNAERDAEQRAKQIDPSIMMNLVQFTSLYMHHSQMLQDYIIAHILRAEMALNKSNKTSSCRMLRHDEPRYHRKQDQLPPEFINHIFTGQHQTTNWLEVDLEIHYLDPSQPEDNKAIIHMHVLATIDDLYAQIQKRGLHAKLGANQNQSYSGEVVEGTKNWGLFLFDLSSHKSHLLLPSSTERMNIYTLYRNSILSPTSARKNLHLKPLFLSLPSPLAEFTNELQTRWYFQQIYQGFRDYGSYLSMISIKREETHISQVVVQCLLCHILLEEKEKIQQIVGTDSMWRMDVKELGQQYCEQLEQFCPKGTASTLSSQQKRYICEDVCKELEAIVTNLKNMEQYYSQVLHQKIAHFEQRCHLLTCSSAIYSPLSQQELLFTAYGLVHIKRTIYVEALRWQDVYAINIVYESDQINIKSIEICCQGNGDKIMKIIPIPQSNDDKIFLNACLILIKNVALRFLRASQPNLYKHISILNSNEEERESIKMDPAQKEGLVQNSPSLSIWQQLTNYIEYGLAVQKQPINLQELKQYPFPQPRLTSQTQWQTYNQPVQHEEKVPEQVKLEEEIIINKIQEEQKQKDIIKEVKPQIDQNIEINTIINKVQQDAKKEDSDENIVVTNSRRSSRRDLPKRRSSRDK